MQTRIHISLEVKDLARSIEFYSKMLGTEPSRTKDDYANYRMDEPYLHLALNKTDRTAEKPKTNQHFGIELFNEDDLNSWLKKARNGGLNARVEEGTTCCYAVADKFWLTDPDGHEWEFWHRKHDVDHAHGEPSLKAEAQEFKPKCCG